MAYGGSSTSSRPSSCGYSCVQIEVDSCAASLSTGKPVTKNSKTNTKTKTKGELNMESPNRVFSETGVSNSKNNFSSAVIPLVSSENAGMSISKQGPEELSTNYHSEYISKGISSRHISCCKSCKTINIISRESEYCKCCSSRSAKTRSQCNSINSASEITLDNECKLDHLTSQSGPVKKASGHPCSRSGKENRHSVWQHKNVGESKAHGPKRLNLSHVERDVRLQEQHFLDKPLTSKGILPTPTFSSSRHSFTETAHGFQKMASEEQERCKGFRGNVLGESSQWSTQHRLNANLHQYGPQSSEVDSWKAESYDRLRVVSNYKIHHSNSNSKKGVGGYRTNFFRPQNMSVYPPKEPFRDPFERHHHKNSNASQGSIHNIQHKLINRPYVFGASSSFSSPVSKMPCSTKLSGPGLGISNEDRPYTSRKIPRKNVSGLSFHSSVSEQINSSCSELKHYNGDTISEEVPCRTKTIPVRRKESSKLGRFGSVSSYNDNGGDNGGFPVYHKGENVSHLERILFPHFGLDHVKASENRSLVSSQKLIAANGKASHTEKTGIRSANAYLEYGTKPYDIPQLLIGSQKALEALNAAYRLELASESFQHAMGHHLAKYETFVHSAAPVFSSSTVCQKCEVCLDNGLPFSSLCKHQIPNTSLHAVWDWYEKPGNYGLEVKAHESRKIKELRVDTPFHAHFVPFLSAVQLFGYPHISNCQSKSIEYMNTDIQQKGEVVSHKNTSNTRISSSSEANEVCQIQEKNNLPVNADSVEKPVRSLMISSCSPSTLPAFSTDAELIFEYFESEQPHQRKPLYEKIVELINADTSNHQVHGDPSHLKGISLHHLHPASWYSVAWYPIYRIPEGILRASFLTYHSLGHMVRRRISNGSVNLNKFCIVCPVLGFQSYNAQGECWFDPKVPVESSLKEFKSSEILKDRLRTLEENALFFSRGCVCKNRVKAVNRHPDYEFFISRKH